VVSGVLVEYYQPKVRVFVSVSSHHHHLLSFPTAMNSWKFITNSQNSQSKPSKFPSLMPQTGANFSRLTSISKALGDRSATQRQITMREAKNVKLSRKLIKISFNVLLIHFFASKSSSRE
jgi:hypothetical protein